MNCLRYNLHGWFYHCLIISSDLWLSYSYCITGDICPSVHVRIWPHPLSGVTRCPTLLYWRLQDSKMGLPSTRQGRHRTETSPGRASPGASQGSHQAQRQGHHQDSYSGVIRRSGRRVTRKAEQGSQAHDRGVTRTKTVVSTQKFAITRL